MIADFILQRFQMLYTYKYWQPHNNTVSLWLLPYTCVTQRCHCMAWLKPDILCVQGLSYQNNPPQFPIPYITIQYIKFTYCKDKFLAEKIIAKTSKYQSLINNIQARGWTIVPLIVIITGARASTHTSSISP
jgi:hypothetical protein